jgi:hypothetical protein
MERTRTSIQIVLQLRDGEFGSTKRCRKGLNPLGDFTIDQTCQFDELVEKIRQCLPPKFHWDIDLQPIRYQRIKEQPQVSLEPLNSKSDFYTLFIKILSRRKLTDSQQITLWIFGNWTHPFDKSKSSPVPSSPTVMHSPLNFTPHERSVTDRIETTGIKLELAEQPDISKIQKGSLFSHSSISQAEMLPISKIPFEGTQDEYLALRVKINGVLTPLPVSKSSLKSLLRIIQN